MKKIIYSLITDKTIGIKVKDDMKLNILRILDNINNDVMVKFSNPIIINNDKTESLSLTFLTYDGYEMTGLYELTNGVKIFKISYIPIKGNSTIAEDYTIIEHSNGLIEYKTKIANNNYSKNEYYYNDKEISEEEAIDMVNPKTK